jgi:hypothetical protein
VSPFWSLSILASLVLLTAVPWLLLGGGRPYMELVARHPVLVAIVAAAWTACLSWLLRRVAEFLLLKRSGAKLKADA